MRCVKSRTVLLHGIHTQIEILIDVCFSVVCCYQYLEKSVIKRYIPRSNLVRPWG
jgi:hypothetical protein